MKNKTPSYPEIARLIAIMAKLRAPGGCPWDHEQTHKSLKPYLIEEAYEVIEAIDENDDAHLQEELGDLLLQVVFHARIAEDTNRFNIEDVAKDIADKLIRRHPHVFGDVTVNSAGEVVKNWEDIKTAEKSSKGIVHKSRLDGVSRALPALFEALKVSKKAAKLGFDWKKPLDVIAKITEEISEVKRAAKRKNQEQLEEELGDLLFATTNLCRKFSVNPEMALKGATRKFRKRFAKMEESLTERDPKKLSFKEWDLLWENAKHNQTTIDRRTKKQ